MVARTARWPIDGNERAAAIPLLGGALLLALYATLFPFDFYLRGPISAGALLARGKWSLLDPLLWPDMPRNIALFVPVGLGLACLLPAHLAARTRLAVTLAVGTALSVALELAQLLLLSRHTALIDVVANGAGALAGAALALLWGGATLRLVTGGAATAVRLLTTVPLAATLLWGGWLLLAGLLAADLQRGAGLGNWDPRLPLVIANEATGDRPWQGSVDALYLGDIALPPQELGLVLAGADPGKLLGPRLLAGYQLRADGAYTHVGGALPALVAQPGKPAPWWMSEAPLSGPVAAMIAADQLTLIADLTSATSEQSGPARIVSLSANPFERNVTIGQEGSDLVVRLRTPLTGANGRYPELHIAGVFADPRPLRLALTYGGAKLRLYLSDHAAPYSFSFAPETMLFFVATPVDSYGVTLNTLPTWLLQALYSALVFMPAGGLLGLAAQGIAPAARAAVLGAGSALPPLLLAAWVARIGGYPPRLGGALLGASFTIATIVLLQKVRFRCGHVERLP